MSCFSSQFLWPDCSHRTPSRFLLVFSLFEWRNAVFFLLALVAYFGHPFVAGSLFLSWAGQEPPLDAHHPWMPVNSRPEEFLSR